MGYSISVGVFDWARFARADMFYPDDIPEEWKLAYYSNEFETACVNVADLPEQRELWEEWVEDLPASFELALYLEHSAQLPKLQQLLQIQACPVTSIIVSAQAGNNLLQKDYLPAVLSAGKDAPGVAVNAQQQIWSPQNVSAANAGYALFPSCENLRQCRAWIEQWLSTTEPEKSVQEKTLWLQGAQTSYSQLSDIRTMVELMGY
jgi:hypothetical protein